MSESESEAKILSSGRSLQSVRFRYSSTAEEPFGLKCILNKDLVYFNFNPFLAYNDQLLEITKKYHWCFGKGINTLLKRL